MQPLEPAGFPRLAVVLNDAPPSSSFINIQGASGEADGTTFAKRC
jgi:hypothetical protein